VLKDGPRNDIEMYVQQIERAGRDGETSDCVLLVMKGQSRFCNTKMCEYYENKHIYVVGMLLYI